MSRKGSLTDLLSPEQLAEFKEAFNFFDVDSKGQISTKEFGTVMRCLGQNPSEAELVDMIAAADKDGSGTVDFNEFAEYMAKKLQRPDSEEEILDALSFFDPRGTGLIDSDELKKLLMSVEDKFTDEELAMFMREADNGATGKIDYQDLVRVMFPK